MDNNKLIIFVAPNVSQLMGGEGIKALQTFEHFKALHPNVVQITHGRNQAHVDRDLALSDVHFVHDNFFSLFIYYSFIFRFFTNVWFLKKAVAMAEKIAADKGFADDDVIIHQTGPNSPVLPRTVSDIHLNSFGPVNGNIHYPPSFYSREPLKNKMSRWLHMPLQKINALFANGLTKADLILVAGGARTKKSLSLLGCQSSKMVEADDCGIQDALLTRPRINHTETNYRFVHFGRLVDYKGTDLMIKALAKTNLPITLDIVGKGDELHYCQSLVEKFGLEDRVTFKDWQPHEALLASLSNYRALALLSLAESNGIVVQEAMALGLPTICLNWGGPQMLVDHGKNGYLIDVSSEEQIIQSVARHLDDLSVNPALAESLSINARTKAKQWGWGNVAQRWLKHFEQLTHQSEQKKTKIDIVDDAPIESAIH